MWLRWETYTANGQPGLNKKGRASWTPAFSPLCFLTGHAMWPVASCSCLHGFLAMMVQPLTCNPEPTPKLLLSGISLQPQEKVTHRNLAMRNGAATVVSLVSGTCAFGPGLLIGGQRKRLQSWAKEDLDWPGEMAQRAKPFAVQAWQSEFRA